jgi:hypothetical protein
VSSNALRPAAAPAPAAAPVAAPTANAAAIPRTADRALAPPPPPASTVAPPAQAAAGASLAQSRAETVKLDALSEVALKVVAEFTPRISTTMDRLAAGAGGAAGGGGGRGGGGGAAGMAVTRQQPTGPARWRIMGSGQVMKSTNGETWVTVPIAPPIFIVSGDAPSPSVCWLAGRAGVVMRSTDATTFSRIVFPDASDLRAINATDARQATVTTASGDVYMTTDGGETWRKIGLQAFRPAAF